MIVYSDRTRTAEPRSLLAALQRATALPRASDEDASSRLIAAGVLEAGLTDALSPDWDEEPPLARQLRALVLDLAHAARDGMAGIRLTSARARLEEIAASPLPGSIRVSEPEGFAFYALYPEMFAMAARRFLGAVRPRHATVIGLRSIGTTLSAVVAAELEAAGVQVRSFTVRPRGHPFDRVLHLGPRLLAALEAGASEHVLVVDEGPGISGSSFACVAEAAMRAGCPEARIALFPSWDSDGAGLRSERARAIWPRLTRWTAGFEEAILSTGRLARPWGGGELRDLSGGLWREGQYAPDHLPAVQPQHERRKYRLDRKGDAPLLLKFVGLGERGRRALARAEWQASMSVAPEVEGMRDGFLACRHHAGRPLRAGELDKDVLDAMGRYLAHLGSQEPLPDPVRFDDILHMTRINLAEGLGPEAAGRTGWMEGMRDAVLARPARACDGRMLPQEWLRTGSGLLKTDGTDHHDDHFWPGAQDMAWDLAGAAVEFGMDSGTRDRLVEDYVAGTRDRGLREVLPFYTLAYLAYRLGYASLAADTLGESDDGLRMAKDRDRYAAALRRELEREGRA